MAEPLSKPHSAGAVGAGARSSLRLVPEATRPQDRVLGFDKSSAACLRQKRYRQRRREGLVTLSVTVDEAAITALLVSAGYLSVLRADEPRAEAAE